MARSTAAAIRRLGRPLLHRVRSWDADDDTTPIPTYEDLYEAHARAIPHTDVIGGGDFDVMGRIQLAVLRDQGLTAHDTVVDLGCGVGRLAVHLVPELTTGRYVGVDVAPTMLVRARQLLAERGIDHPDVQFVHANDVPLPLADRSVDMLVAFSVFTHMEHEDTFRYLQDIHRVTVTGGTLIFSALPMRLDAARHVFLDSASLDLGERWSQVRNVVTTDEMVMGLAEMTGWAHRHTYLGDVEDVPMPGGTKAALGQAIYVFTRV